MFARDPAAKVDVIRRAASGSSAQKRASAIPGLVACACCPSVKAPRWIVAQCWSAKDAATINSREADFPSTGATGWDGVVSHFQLRIARTDAAHPEQVNFAAVALSRTRREKVEQRAENQRDIPAPSKALDRAQKKGFPT